MSNSPGKRALRPPALNRDAPTVVIPAKRGDLDTLKTLLRAPQSPTVPASPELGPESEERRPTPHSFALPEGAAESRCTLTIVRGIDAGRVFSVDRESSIIGRGRDAEVLVDDEAVSRHHARLIRRMDGRFALEDLQSTNGTFLRGKRIQMEVLSPGDRVQLGPRLSLRFAIVSEDEDRLQRRLYESSVRDGLTGLLNRATFQWRLRDAMQEAQRKERPLSLLMIDLDHFKRVNDSLGHSAGDELLRRVAERMLQVVRNTDIVARYGGEEFVVVARSTSAPRGKVLAERIRVAIERIDVLIGGVPARTSASIGVVTLSDRCQVEPEEAIRLADQQMYEAKRAGRNRVCAQSISWA